MKGSLLYSQSENRSEIQLKTQNSQELKPGESIRRLVGGVEKQSYLLNIDAGQTVVVTVPKHSIAVNVKTYTPSGEQIGDQSQQQWERIIRPIFVVAEIRGVYRVDISAGWPGEYVVASSLPRQITETDKKHLTAQQLYAEYLIKIPGIPNLPSEERTRRRLEALQKRLAVYRTIDDPKFAAISLLDMGSFLSGVGEHSRMVNHYKEAAEIFRSQGNAEEECTTLISIAGDAAFRLSDFQKATDYLLQALSVSRSKRYKYGEARALYQLGAVYQFLEDDRKAADLFRESIAVIRSEPSPPVTNMNEALTLSNLGNLYVSSSGDDKASQFNTGIEPDPQKAIVYYRQALEIYRDLKTKKHRGGMTGEASMLLNIGNSYKALGNYTESQNFLEETLRLHRDLRYRPGEINALRSLGNLYSLKGEYQSSVPYFSQAIELLNSGFDNSSQAGVLLSIAKDYYRAGETQKALDLCNEALKLSRSRQQLGVSAASLYEIARIERDIGNFANARNRIGEAIEIAESIRANITVQETRASYFATVKRYYEFYIDLQMQAHKAQPERGFDSLALQASERSRSRSLLDLLAVANVDINQGVEQSLLDRERLARERLADKAYGQNLLLLRKHTAEEAEKMNAEVTLQTDAYQSIQTEIKNKSPRYAALTQPTSLNAKQIQQLLDPGTVLLEYSLGEKKSYLWVVTSASITSFDLPSRGEIEGRARKVYELSTARNIRLKGETDDQRRSRIRRAETEYPIAATALTNIVTGPAAEHIIGKRLLIVPDGALHYISFSALSLPKNEVASDSGPDYLGLSHEIVTLPSASSLSRLREDSERRQPASKILAVFADPVFDQADKRIAAVARRNQTTNDQAVLSNKKIEGYAINRDFEQAVADVGLAAEEVPGLPRLPFSRREADAIFNASPKSLSLMRTDFSASKQEVFASRLDQYRILHFATHGMLNSQHPALSGIVLSLVDRKGDGVDGFLRLQDIYNLKLNADLVVLSACNTALGKEFRGEGLIGLTRGFMYAGAPRVVASLWKVDDAATAALMTLFYKRMLVDNLRPAAALRSAQIEMMKQPRWRSPYYWAPFVLQGEWK